MYKRESTNLFEKIILKKCLRLVSGEQEQSGRTSPSSPADDNESDTESTRLAEEPNSHQAPPILVGV